MRRTAIIVAIGVFYVWPLARAHAQADPTGQCFCDATGTVGIAQLIRAVNIALGTADCPAISSCNCCACDFGGGDIECGNGDVDCLQCVSLGGAQAADCSICEGTCNAGATLCMQNPQHCQQAPPGQCTCCACDFGGGDVECGVGDLDCADCLSAGGVQASDCSACAGTCPDGDTLCMNNPQQCTMSSGVAAAEHSARSTARYSAHARKSLYPGKGG